MSTTLTPWWMMRDDPDDWDFEPLFSIALSVDYAVQPQVELCDNAIDPQTSHEETKVISRWLQKRMAFRRETYSMISMLDRLQVREEETPIDWLKIVCVKNDSNDDIFVYDDGLDSGVSVKVKCDPDAFFGLNELEKSEWVIHVVEQACEKLFDKTNIALPNVIDACNQVKRLHYRNKWMWGQRWSPDGKHQARVSITQDTQKTHIDFEIYNAKSFLLHSTCIEDTPYLPDVWRRYLNDIEWVSNDSVRLHMDETYIELGFEDAE